VTLKKYFSSVYQFWKQQYINQNGSGLVVKIVKCSQMIPDSIPTKPFFHKIYSDPPKRAELGLGQTV